MKAKKSETQQQIDNVLMYHDRVLSSIHFPSMESVNDRISESEALLKELGIECHDNGSHAQKQQKRVIHVPSWSEVALSAETVVGANWNIEDLFSAEELEKNKSIIQKLNSEFNEIHRLDMLDIVISAICGIIAGAVDILLVGMPQRTPGGLKAKPLADYVRDWFEKRFPPEEMEKLANSKVSKVPFDAQDNRNTVTYVEGLSAYYHRLLSLGHDPILGLIFGVYDILHGTMTTIDKRGRFVVQLMENYADRKEIGVFAAVAKLFIHYASDITTSMGLPAPFMNLFNLFQCGRIGDEDQTIAEIVQGMYYEGYDFVHFCSLSLPVMLIEVIVRLSYSLKQISEGHSIKASIPFSLNHEKHPKLATQLFIAHSASTAINAGKVLFTQSPMAINYPQWISFAKYSYSQLKWILFRKPLLRDAYVRGVISTELEDVYQEIDQSFRKLTNEYIVVFN